MWSDESPGCEEVRANQFPRQSNGRMPPLPTASETTQVTHGAGPEFEDFRKPDTPPPVFESKPVTSPPQTPIDETPPPLKGKNRPRLGSRGVSFSKSILGLSSQNQAPLPDGTASGDGQARRDSKELSGISDESAFGSKIPEDIIDNKSTPINIATLEHPEVKKALTRSSTTSSVEDWLGLKKSKQDMRMANLADSKKPLSRRQTLGLQGHLPRISTFRTEKEFRALNKKVAAGNGAASESIAQSPPSTPTIEEPPTPKKERPRFLRSRSKKSLASLPTTPSADSADTRDPIEEPSTPDGLRTPKSPSKIYGGLLWQPKCKSNDSNATPPKPILAKSRRTGTFDEIAAPPSHAPARPGVPEFRIPDLHPDRPPLPKYPSSQISPGNVSGQNRHLYESFEDAIQKGEQAREIKLRPPAKRHGGAVGPGSKTRDYLLTEARRINTPPVVKPGKGNRLMGQFWDHKMPGIKDTGFAAANMGSQHVHTPFPMPVEAYAFSESPSSAPHTPVPISERDADWYRVRADAVLDEDELPMDIDELKAMFDWDIPDHLPSSPLCPANPKHVSGGNGICVYHGRGKRVAEVKS